MFIVGELLLQINTRVIRRVSGIVLGIDRVVLHLVELVYAFSIQLKDNFSVELHEHKIYLLRY